MRRRVYFDTPTMTARRRPAATAAAPAPTGSIDACCGTGEGYAVKPGGQYCGGLVYTVGYCGVVTPYGWCDCPDADGQ